MSSELPTLIFLVRHAETEWNTLKKFQGHLDSRLTPVGLLQADRLAARLATEGITTVYSSDQGRALQTASVVARALKLPVVPRAELREIDCGEWTGLAYSEVASTWPEDHARWTLRPASHRMPGGEAVADVTKRAMSFLAEVRETHKGEKVCAVTHNTVVRAVACSLMGWDLDRLWEGPRQPNCAVNLLETRNGTVRLVVAGDASHLDASQISTVRFESPPEGLV